MNTSCDTTSHKRKTLSTLPLELAQKLRKTAQNRTTSSTLPCITLPTDGIIPFQKEDHRVNMKKLASNLTREWYCSFCGNQNPLEMVQCRRCLASSSEGVYRVQQNICQWRCLECQTDCILEMTACPTCESTRPIKFQSHYPWSCRNCCFPLNLPIFSQCLRCTISRDDSSSMESLVASPLQLREEKNRYRNFLLVKGEGQVSTTGVFVKAISLLDQFVAGAVKFKNCFPFPAFNGCVGVVEIYDEQLAPRILSDSSTSFAFQTVICGEEQWLCKCCGFPNGNIKAQWCSACGSATTL